MPKIWRNDLGYDLLRKYADRITKRCFSSIKTVGKENYPDISKYSVILASNHVNTLMDPMVLLQDHAGPTAFGARADIFRNPRVASILNWLRIVPLARERDGVGSIRENFNIFSEVVNCIGHDIPFCLFVEGTHYPGYEVHPVKHGIFHIAASAAESLSKPVLIVPVGLSYDDFYKPKNNVVISYGKPVPAEEILALPNRDRSGKLTELIQEQVHDISGTQSRKATGLLLWIQRIMAAPLLALTAIFGAPILILSAYLVNGRKDKAWANSMRLCANFFFLPIVMIIAAVLLFCFVKWYYAIAGLLLVWLSPSLFYSLLKIFRNENK